MFNFNESLSATTRVSSDPDADGSTTLYVIGALVGLAVVAFIVFGILYQLKARKRYQN